MALLQYVQSSYLVLVLVLLERLLRQPIPLVLHFQLQSRLVHHLEKPHVFGQALRADIKYLLENRSQIMSCAYPKVVAEHVDLIPQEATVSDVRCCWRSLHLGCLYSPRFLT